MNKDFSEETFECRAQIYQNKDVYFNKDFSDERFVFRVQIYQKKDVSTKISKRKC